MIKKQLEEVRKHIEDACRRAGRSPEEVCKTLAEQYSKEGR